LAGDDDVLRWLPAETVRRVLARGADTGDAASRCLALSDRIRDYTRERPPA